MQAIIVVEDNVRYYSSFLPVIYSELMHHSQQPDARGREPVAQADAPAGAAEDPALHDVRGSVGRTSPNYHANVLGVISDIEFPKDGVLCADAGVEFARARARSAARRAGDAPVEPPRERSALAASVGAAFLLKESPTLLHQLQQFMVDIFGFGDFVFRLPDGTVVGRAQRPEERSRSQLRTVPAEQPRLSRASAITSPSG